MVFIFQFVNVVIPFSIPLLRTRMPTPITTIQHSFGSASHSNQRKKRNKRNPDWKRRSNTLTADAMILYIENPKDATRKLLELINEHS